MRYDRQVRSLAPIRRTARRSATTNAGLRNSDGCSDDAADTDPAPRAVHLGADQRHQRPAAPANDDSAPAPMRRSAAASASSSVETPSITGDGVSGDPEQLPVEEVEAARRPTGSPPDRPMAGRSGERGHGDQPIAISTVDAASAARGRSPRTKAAAALRSDRLEPGHVVALRPRSSRGPVSRPGSARTSIAERVAARLEIRNWSNDAQAGDSSTTGSRCAGRRGVARGCRHGARPACRTSRTAPCRRACAANSAAASPIR